MGLQKYRQTKRPPGKAEMSHAAHCITWRSSGTVAIAPADPSLGQSSDVGRDHYHAGGYRALQ